MRIRFTIRTLACLTLLIAIVLGVTVTLNVTKREFAESVARMDDSCMEKLIADAGLPETRYVTSAVPRGIPKLETLPVRIIDVIMMRRHCRVSFVTCRRSGMMFYHFNNTSDYYVSLFGVEYVSSTEQKGATVGM